jgi:hypothetical protein
LGKEKEQAKQKKNNKREVYLWREEVFTHFAIIFQVPASVPLCWGGTIGIY